MAVGAQGRVPLFYRQGRIKRAIEMGKQVPAARRLPFQAGSQRLGVEADDEDVGQAGEILARRLDSLRPRREVDVAVAEIDGGAVEALDDVRASLQARAQKLAREGVLPIGLIGQQVQAQLVEALVPVRSAWLSLRASFPLAADKRAINLPFGELQIDDWLDKLCSNGQETAWLMQISSKVTDKSGLARGDKLMLMWLRQLAAAALGFPVTGYLVARDAIVSMAPLDPAASRDALATLLALWREGMNHPLPTACKTGLALVQQGDPRAVYDGGFELSGERDELCLARLWPEFSALALEEAWEDCTRELYGPLADWLQQHITIDPISAPDDGAGEEQ